MVTLVNRTRRMQTFNLAHPDHTKVLQFLEAVTDKRGQTVLRRQAKAIADSLTLMARGTPGSSRTGLPDTILECPEIKAAIDRGDLIKQTEKEPMKPARAPVPSASADASERSSRRRKG